MDSTMSSPTMRNEQRSVLGTGFHPKRSSPISAAPDERDSDTESPEMQTAIWSRQEDADECS
jgi:hypothetical protein